MRSNIIEHVSVLLLNADQLGILQPSIPSYSVDDRHRVDLLSDHLQPISTVSNKARERHPCFNDKYI